ncbi:MAG TPA: rhodanese-like domain-containing protein [Candidatus Dormibacteraeota bacterium]|jgi:rhodanese-related sulfurtransferase|nr:rhodanese-like domain-containing protein [Candidatus Dormibacteraeota bacterium]
MSELEVTTAELKKRLDAGERLLLVDVREQWEWDVCRIEGAKLIPMRTIPANLQALDVEEPVICYCHHGMRSLDVAAWLRKQGVESAQSLAGGIERWSAEIDPKVPRY